MLSTPHIVKHGLHVCARFLLFYTFLPDKQLSVRPNVGGSCCAALAGDQVELEKGPSEITEKAPTRAFSCLKAATSAFPFKTLLRHYPNRALTPRYK